MTEHPTSTHHPEPGEPHRPGPGGENTRQYPVPALRDHIAVTTPGGWNWKCPCGGTGWRGGNAPQGPVTCRYETDGIPCGREVVFPGPQWKSRNPVTHEGWVIDIVTSPTEETLVYLGATPRSRSVSGAQVVAWSQVLAVSRPDATPSAPPPSA